MRAAETAGARRCVLSYKCMPAHTSPPLTAMQRQRRFLRSHLIPPANSTVTSASSPTTELGPQAGDHILPAAQLFASAAAFPSQPFCPSPARRPCTTLVAPPLRRHRIDQDEATVNQVVAWANTKKQAAAAVEATGSHADDDEEFCTSSSADDGHDTLKALSAHPAAVAMANAAKAAGRQDQHHHQHEYVQEQQPDERIQEHSDEDMSDDAPEGPPDEWDMPECSLKSFVLLRDGLDAAHEHEMELIMDGCRFSDTGHKQMLLRWACGESGEPALASVMHSQPHIQPTLTHANVTRNAHD